MVSSTLNSPKREVARTISAGTVRNFTLLSPLRPYAALFRSTRGCCDVASPALRQSQGSRLRAQGRVFSLQPSEGTVLLSAAAPRPPAFARDPGRPFLGRLRQEPVAQISPAGAVAAASFHARGRRRRPCPLFQCGGRIRRLGSERRHLGRRFPVREGV